MVVHIQMEGIIQLYVDVLHYIFTHFNVREVQNSNLKAYVKIDLFQDNYCTSVFESFSSSVPYRPQLKYSNFIAWLLIHKLCSDQR